MPGGSGVRPSGAKTSCSLCNTVRKVPRMREQPPVLTTRHAPLHRRIGGASAAGGLTNLLLLHSDRRPLPATQVLNGRAATRSRKTSEAQVVLSAVVEDKHQSSSDTAHH